MRVTLIHNPGAGDESQPEAKALRKLIRDAGHEVEYQSCKEKGWTATLKEKADLIAIAGGDGTVGRVARRMAGRGVPLAVLPMGTANNVARSLDIADVPVEKLVRGWESAERVPLDAATAKGPWGERRFVEGLGIGLFAWTMPHAQDSKALSKIEDAEESLAYVLRMLQERLEHYKPRVLKAKLDGTDISGEFVMFEVMNLQYIGPNLHLAPRAVPGDGLLHVVFVTEAERERLSKYLAQWEKGKAPPVDLPTLEGARLEIARGDYEVHVDDFLWPDPDGEKKPAAKDIEVEIEHGVLEFLLPAARK
jgi:diacylglycerol kinase (ATP)